MKNTLNTTLSLLALCVTSFTAAHDDINATRADAHAPIGIMGDHLHKTGEWMFSYRFMNMSMQGNLQGDNDIDDATLVTTVPNSFAGMPMMPPTLRVAPNDMSTDMHMLGVMYAPTDNLTLMAMLNYLDKSMSITTYQGMMGTTVLGTFNSAVKGVGDTRLGLMYRLYENDTHHVHANLSLSLPTGSIDEAGQVLTPMNMTPTVRLPYTMQLGSGTLDALPGITYTGKSAPWAWGAQLMATIRTEDNKFDYRLGNQEDFNAWGQYAIAPNLSTSLGFEYKHSDAIDGMDKGIMLPVQTADPSNYGGTQQSIKLGLNWVSNSGHRLAFEYKKPYEQDANGIQMKMDTMWTLGYQKGI